MVATFMSVEATIQGHAAAAGRPDHNRAGTTRTAPSSICAVIARAGSRLAFTAAFQPACSRALNRAAPTSVASIAQPLSGPATMTTA